METRGEYRVGDNDASTDTEQKQSNVRAFPARAGFTQADNAYFDGLFGCVSPTAYYCLMYVVRNTLGYHRESVRLSFKQLGDALGLSRNTAMKGLQELEAARVIGSDGSERGRTQVRAYHLLPIDGWTLPQPTTSPNFALDDTSPENALAPTSPNFDTTSAENGLVGGQTSPNFGHPINKERKKEKYISCPTPDGADGGETSSSKPKSRTTTPKPLPEDSEALRLAAYLRDRILAHSPNNRDATAALNPAKLANWAIPVDRMLRLDHRTPDGIRAVIDFATTDDFWHSNILSTGKLRDQYDALEAKMRAKSRPRQSAPVRPEPPRQPMRSVPPLNAKPPQLD